MTKPPATGAELMARIRERRRAVSTGRASGVRLTQAGGYVGIKLRPAPPVDQFPLGKAWLELFAAGRRDAGRMAREACLSVGRSYAHQGKFDKAVKDELRDLGKERLWTVAKVKSGRPPPRRA